MEKSRRKVFLVYVLQIVLGLGFLVTAAFAMNACFLIEEQSGKCVAGSSHTFFTVSRGQSFHILSAGVVFVGHGMWGLSYARRGASSVVVGALIGSGACVSLIAIAAAGLWGSISSTVHYLECSSPSRLPRPDVDTQLKCSGYEAAFTALCVLASLVFLTQATCTIMLYVWQTDFVKYEVPDREYGEMADSLARTPHLQQTEDSAAMRRGNNNNNSNSNQYHTTAVPPSIFLNVSAGASSLARLNEDVPPSSASS